MKAILRYDDGFWPNFLAISYTFAGYGVGVWLLTVEQYWLNAVGVLLLSHALVYSAYLIHEFAHQTIFQSRRTNDVFGEMMSWLSGSCYARFDDLRKKHIRHHADRADVITFDWREFFNKSPRWFQKTVIALEWFYIPAIELVMHGFVMTMPFFSPYHKDMRLRVISIFAIRATLFGLLAWYSPKAILLYALSYMLFITVLRFMDAFQHTYEAYPILEGKMPDIDRKDKQYEYENTYSNLISVRWPVLNLLTLNFAYHNAHHTRAGEPWYRLPALHESLYGKQDPQVLPSITLLKSFHQNRVRRVVDPSYGEVTPDGDRVAHFYGADGVSFLTAV